MYSISAVIETAPGIGELGNRAPLLRPAHRLASTGEHGVEVAQVAPDFSPSSVGCQVRPSYSAVSPRSAIHGARSAGRPKRTSVRTSGSV